MPNRERQPVKGSKGNRITHRVPIETRGQSDGFVGKWLRAAYDAGC